MGARLLISIMDAHRPARAELRKFLLNVLLARTLSEEDYGEFTLFLGYPQSVRLCAASGEERARAARE